MKKLLFSLGLLSLSVTSCVQEMADSEEQDVVKSPIFAKINKRFHVIYCFPQKTI